MYWIQKYDFQVLSRKNKFLYVANYHTNSSETI